MSHVLSQAHRSIKLARSADISERENFTCLMRQAGLAFTGWVAKGPDLCADLVIFSDGSGYFADSDSHDIYMPWPIESDDEDSAQKEFLPLMIDPTAITAAGIDFWTFTDIDGDTCPEVVAHARTCIKAHYNPPEAMRELVWAFEHSFEWLDGENADKAKDIIVLCALVLHPEARELTIRGDARAGISRAQQSSEAAFLRMMATSGLEGVENMTASSEGLPHAEISEGGEDFKAIQNANEVLAWLSTRLLLLYGRPTGWEVNYNDGHRTRMSGYSAWSDSINIEVSGRLSNHQRLDQRKALSRILVAEGLMDGFQQILREFRFKPLPVAMPQGNLRDK